MSKPDPYKVALLGSLALSTLLGPAGLAVWATVWLAIAAWSLYGPEPHR
jgi:hypothetical protein